MTSNRPETMPMACRQSHTKSGPHISCNGEKIALIGIVKGSLSHPHKPKKAQIGYVYLNEVSNSSYITKDMAHTLGLPIHKNPPLNTTTCFGTTNDPRYPVTQVRVRGKRGQALLNVLVVDKITNPLRINKWKEATVAFPRQTLDLKNTENTVEADILVGADHITDIRGAKVIRTGNLQAINTILGPYLIGELQTHNVGTKHSLTSINNLSKAEKKAPMSECNREWSIL